MESSQRRRARPRRAQTRRRPGFLRRLIGILAVLLGLAIAVGAVWLLKDLGDPLREAALAKDYTQIFSWLGGGLMAFAVSLLLLWGGIRVQRP
ncbi:hypothetical protein ACL90Y_08545 [Micrococcus luteus]